MFLTSLEKLTLLKICYLSAYKSIFNKSLGEISIPTFSKTLLEVHPAFVSVYVDSELRGCLGYIKVADPLYKSIELLAYDVVCRDYRFEGIQQEEWEKMFFELSILFGFVIIDDIYDFQLQKEGLYITCNYKSGVLLPQVATKHNISKQEFVEALLRKANIQIDELKNCTIQKFSALVFSNISQD